jgi:hypothetical protein
MGSLGAIYKPETVCPFALTSCQLLKPDFVPFWFKRINPISLGVLHDSYNGSLYVLLGNLTLANCLKWILRGSQKVRNKTGLTHSFLIFGSLSHLSLVWQFTDWFSDGLKNQN